MERKIYLNKLISTKENGFPKVITGIRRCGKSYLLKDIYKKYLLDEGISEENIIYVALDELCTLISQGCGQLFNSEKIANTYQSITKSKIDKDTVTKYINYFEDAFIISQATRYDVKGKRNIGALRKYCFIDNGLRNARLNFAYYDEGQMLENMIYNELLYNGYTVNVGAFERVEKDINKKSIKKTYEIDFVAKKDVRQYYIQVSSDISSTETKQREIKPFISLNDQIRKILVINKPINETLDENGFTVIGVADFLLRFIK